MDIGKIEKKEITQEMRESYLDYAMSVIISRALPDVRDGLKPVHRRILYVMNELGLDHSAKFKKCAAVIGDTLARYHPHGDQAVYDALVRMAQDFSLRYPLVDGQGNFGCFTKDTKVILTDGRSLDFEKLIEESRQGKKNWTFSFNFENQEIEIAEIKDPRLTKKKQKLIEVILDNDQRIKCTYNHLFMLRDGNYIEAQYLKTNDSLMPLYINSSGDNDKNLKNYKIVYQPVKEDSVFVHHLADKWNLENNHKNIPKVEKSLNYFDDFDSLVSESKKLNHKIKKINFLQNKEDVYDLTIDKNHNFALAAGVFVHNSIDDDPAAAYRYTESRLTHLSEHLLQDLEKDTVDWQPNYDGTRQEPKVLPAKIPNLLLNGAIGIAVGMATNIPPHNLGEVANALIYLIENPNPTNNDLLKFIKGPDFPTGGLIYNKKDIASAYSAGRGSIVIRGRAEISIEGKRHQIIINEIPYNVVKSTLVEKVAQLATEKRIEGIKDIRDESDKDGMRIVIDLKSDVQPQKILNQLYLLTDLQKTFHMHILALVDGLQPKTLSLKEVLEEFLNFRIEVTRRRTKFDLGRARERFHILEGLDIALNNIDAVIKTIRASKDRETAKINLMKKFKFTDIQANAILEMRLQALVNLEREKIKDELEEKRKLIQELTLILKEPKMILSIIKKETNEVVQKFADKRKTEVIHSEISEFKEEDLIKDEEVIISLTGDGYIKRLKADAFKVQKRGGRGVIGAETVEEAAAVQLFSCHSHDSLLFFSNFGKAYQAKAYEIPEGTRISKGKAILNLLNLTTNEKINSLLVINPADKVNQKYLILATKDGIIKKTDLDFYTNIKGRGILAVKLKGNDELVTAKISSGDNDLILITKLGQSIRFKESKIRPLGRNSSGLRAISLVKSDSVVAFESFDKTKTKILLITEFGFAKQTDIGEYRLQNRGGVGIKVSKITPKTGPIASVLVYSSQTEDLIITSSKGQVIRIKIVNIPTLKRSSQGVRVLKLTDGDKVSSATVI